MSPAEITNGFTGVSAFEHVFSATLGVLVELACLLGGGDVLGREIRLSERFLERHCLDVRRRDWFVVWGHEYVDL